MEMDPDKQALYKIIALQSNRLSILEIEIGLLEKMLKGRFNVKIAFKLLIKEIKKKLW